MISVAILLGKSKAVALLGYGDNFVNVPTGHGSVTMFTDTSARAKAIAAAINGDLDAQFEDDARAVKYNFDAMEVGADDLERIKDFLAGSAGREAIVMSFLWENTPEGEAFWSQEWRSADPISDKARASLEAMVAQWDAEQAVKS